MSNEFYPGAIVFDKKRTDPTDDLLVVMDHDAGPLRGFSGQKYRLIKNNDINTEIYGGPVPDETECISAVYISEDNGHPAVIGKKEYTFPVDRMETVDSHPKHALEGLHPYQYALAQFLGELMRAMDTKDISIESVDDLQVLCMEASIDGKVITRGTNLGLGRTPEASR